jgi:ketosteroid isomerase-like protein
VLLLFSTACSRSSREPAPAVDQPSAVPKSANASPVSDLPAPPSSTPPPSPSLSEAAVRSLLDAWLDAQNRGDFGAYERLYAERFTGIKRSGERTRNFARSDWMSDRASMFKRPMRVTASAVSLTVAPRLARVFFEQAWSSAKYRDAGPKELLIVPGPSAALIAREEMLASTVGSDRPVAPGSRLRVVDAGLVILSDDVTPDWARGTLRSPATPRPDVAEVLRDADESRLPPALAALASRSLRVFDAQGHACETRVAALAVRGAVIPHFSMGQASEDGSVPNPEQRNAEVWALSEHGGRQLVGVLEPACDGSFALDASDLTPEVVPAEPAAADVQRAAVSAFRALPDYARIQRRYAEETGLKTPWHEDASHHTLDVWSFTPRAGRRLIVVAAEAGEYCGGFGAGLNAVFAFDAGARPALLGAFEGEPFAPASAFDLDADGQLEILSGPEGFSRERALIHRQGSRLVRDVLFAVPFLDCPC